MGMLYVRSCAGLHWSWQLGRVAGCHDGRLLTLNSRFGALLAFVRRFFRNNVSLEGRAIGAQHELRRFAAVLARRDIYGGTAGYPLAAVPRSSRKLSCHCFSFLSLRVVPSMFVTTPVLLRSTNRHVAPQPSPRLRSSYHGELVVRSGRPVRCIRVGKRGDARTGCLRHTAPRRKEEEGSICVFFGGGRFFARVYPF